MTPTLSFVVDHPDGTSSEEVRAASAVRIGRDERCDIILGSLAVSRFHVQVEVVPRGLRITDRSSNGTFVGEELLHAASGVFSSAVDMRIGPYRLSVARAERLSPVQGDSPDLRRRMHRELLDHLDLSALEVSRMDDAVLRPSVVEALERIVESHESELPSDAERARLVSEMTDEVLGLGPLQGLLDDDTVSEIMVVEPETIYVERAGRLELSGLRFIDDESCRAVIERIVTPLGRRIDESTPLVDARLEDGSRVNAVIPPLALRGPCITIRKFPNHPLGMGELVALRTLDRAMAAFLKRCVRARKNIVISGGTGSGKTTLLNVLSTEIPRGERIVTIEDAAELRLDQPHVVALESRPCNLEGRGEYTIRDLVKNALRMRPDRILVGECRGGEAVDMLQAMNTGHEGSMTTTHANSAREAVKRIETLCLMSGLELSPKVIREQVVSSIHVIVQQMRFSDGSRRVTSISEVSGLDDEGEITLRDIFRFRREGTGSDGAVAGKHHPTGYVPSFLGEFIETGLVRDGEYL